MLPALAGLGFAASVSLALAFVAMNSELLIANGFERAFASLDAPLPPARRAYDGIVGSEDFWLRSNANVGVIKAAAVGQRIAFDFNGVARDLVILDVREGSDAITYIDTAGGRDRVLMITCRDLQAPSSGILQLRLEAGRIVEVTGEAAGRAL